MPSTAGATVWDEVLKLLKGNRRIVIRTKEAQNQLHLELTVTISKHRVHVSSKIAIRSTRQNQ